MALATSSSSDSDKGSDGQSTDTEKESKQERRRKRVCEEIIDTEITYQNHLRLIVQHFEQPLRELQIIPDHVIVTIFSNIKQIISIQEELQQHLNESIGHAFLQITPFFKLYSTYANNHERALGALIEWEQKVPELGAFRRHQEEQPVLNGLKLNALLITPVQRIPRYKLLLEELLHYTPSSHHDYTSIQEAVKQVSLVAAHINEHIRQQENFNKMLAIQKSLAGPVAPRILTPGRMFIKDGPLKKVCRKGGRSAERMFYLFSDMLMYAKPKMLDSGTSNSYVCCCLMPLQHCMVARVFGGNKGQEGSLFTITCKTESLLLYSDQKTVDSWIATLTKSIGLLVKNRASLRKESSAKAPVRKAALVRLAKMEKMDDPLTAAMRKPSPRSSPRNHGNSPGTPGETKSCLSPRQACKRLPKIHMGCLSPAGGRKKQKRQLQISHIPNSPDTVEMDTIDLESHPQHPGKVAWGTPERPLYPSPLTQRKLSDNGYENYSLQSQESRLHSSSSSLQNSDIDNENFTPAKVKKATNPSPLIARNMADSSDSSTPQSRRRHLQRSSPSISRKPPVNSQYRPVVNSPLIEDSPLLGQGSTPREGKNSTSQSSLDELDSPNVTTRSRRRQTRPSLSSIPECTAAVHDGIESTLPNAALPNSQGRETGSTGEDEYDYYNYAPKYAHKYSFPARYTFSQEDIATPQSPSSAEIIEDVQKFDDDDADAEPASQRSSVVMSLTEEDLMSLFEAADALESGLHNHFHSSRESCTNINKRKKKPRYSLSRVMPPETPTKPSVDEDYDYNNYMPRFANRWRTPVRNDSVFTEEAGSQHCDSPTSDDDLVDGESGSVSRKESSDVFYTGKNSYSPCKENENRCSEKGENFFMSAELQSGAKFQPEKREGWKPSSPLGHYLSQARDQLASHMPSLPDGLRDQLSDMRNQLPGVQDTLRGMTAALDTARVFNPASPKCKVQ